MLFFLGCSLGETQRRSLFVYIHTFFVCICSFKYFVLFFFFFEVFIDLMLSLESLFLMYSLDTSPYSNIALTNIFSCLLVLIVLLEELKFCILMKFNLLLFFAILVLCLRNICLFQVHSFFLCFLLEYLQF